MIGIEFVKDRQSKEADVVASRPVVDAESNVGC